MAGTEQVACGARYASADTSSHSVPLRGLVGDHCTDGREHVEGELSASDGRFDFA